MELDLVVNKEKELKSIGEYYLNNGNITNLNKNINLTMPKDMELNKYDSKKNFENIVTNVLDKGTDYILKALPMQENVRDVLLDVKRAFKTKDFKNIISTAVSSSIREGLEFLGAPINIVKDINKIKNVALKGGLRQAVIAGIDIMQNKYMKNNLLGDIAGILFDKTKDFVRSNSFIMKIDEGIKKITKKVQGFNDTCNKWYKAYTDFDLNNINNIAKDLKSMKRGLNDNKECLRQNSIIQNMTSMINMKKDKLSPIQLQFCNEV